MLLEDFAQLASGRADSALGNDVAWECVAHHLAINNACRGWVIDSAPKNIAAERIFADDFIRQETAQVAAPELIERSRDARGPTACIRFLITLVGHIEKCLIAAIVNPGQPDGP